MSGERLQQQGLHGLAGLQGLWRLGAGGDDRRGGDGDRRLGGGRLGWCRWGRRAASGLSRALRRRGLCAWLRWLLCVLLRRLLGRLLGGLLCWLLRQRLLARLLGSHWAAVGGQHHHMLAVADDAHFHGDGRTGTEIGCRAERDDAMVGAHDHVALPVPPFHRALNDGARIHRLQRFRSIDQRADGRRRRRTGDPDGRCRRNEAHCGSSRLSSRFSTSRAASLFGERSKIEVWLRMASATLRSRRMIPASGGDAFRKL
ncbi:MAG: hypothetical protein H5U25_00060 [Oceanibaculum nanhaiense]|nr:hypothetical protein [Oceanibaculum nanhaiense]